jgi:hypothetical protein
VVGRGDSQRVDRSTWASEVDMANAGGGHWGRWRVLWKLGHHLSRVPTHSHFALPKLALGLAMASVPALRTFANGLQLRSHGTGVISETCHYFYGGFPQSPCYLSSQIVPSIFSSSQNVQRTRDEVPLRPRSRL